MIKYTQPTWDRDEEQWKRDRDKALTDGLIGECVDGDDGSIYYGSHFGGAALVMIAANVNTLCGMFLFYFSLYLST